jgi:hypothetical protein
VRELKGGSVIALRFARVVSDAQSRLDLDASELARLSRSDRLKIDVAVFDQGMSLLRAVPPSQRPPALIIPLSFSSLSNVDDRARMVSGLNEARGCVPQGIICELCDIEGVPAATLLGAVEVVRPFSLFVIGQVHELTAGQAHLLREARLHGVSVMCPPADSAAELDRWAQRSIRPAKKAVSGVLVYRAPSDAVARVLGATHASVRPA